MTNQSNELETICECAKTFTVKYNYKGIYQIQMLAHDLFLLPEMMKEETYSVIRIC